MAREAVDRGGPDWAAFVRDRRDAVDAVTAKWVSRAEGKPTKSVRPPRSEPEPTGDRGRVETVRSRGQSPDANNEVEYGKAQEGAITVEVTL